MIGKVNTALGAFDLENLSVTYDGTYIDHGMVFMEDGEYRLFSFTTSGTLTIKEPVTCDVCVVGGGANGNGYGGAGAFMKNAELKDFEGGTVIVGGSAGSSSIGGVSVDAVTGKNGGTGGGSNGTIKSHYSSTTGWGYSYITQTAGTGDGLSKYPFGDETYIDWVGKPHCAGGGGGSQKATDDFGGTTYKQAGGVGGTNGGNGNTGATKSSISASGGVYGGGAGGIPSNPGSKATYYGSGGGGKGYTYFVSSSATDGAGYQGIVYLRIPVVQ